jgi:ketosteroid isomerase-like protein
MSDRSADAEQIARNFEAWKMLGATGDPDKAMTYFADDVLIFPAGQPVIRGRAAVRRLVERRQGARPVTVWDVPSSITVAAAADLAYFVTGNRVTTIDTAGRSITQHNRDIQIWRKDPNNSWKEIVVILNAAPMSAR